MPISTRAQSLITEFSSDKVKMGDIKKRAKTIKKDHGLALELWNSGRFFPRMLAVLIFDKTRLDQAVIDTLAADMAAHPDSERDHLSEWLLANQLMKDKALVALLEGWESHPTPLLRRLFWYHQARLRWTGQTPPPNTPALMTALEANLARDEPVVQWAMNFCAGQIGVRQPEFRDRCVKLGEATGLYRDDVVPRNCTPGYLPEFIRIEAAKLAP